MGCVTIIKDIIETAIDAGIFKTLAAALTAADLLVVLKGAGSFTVFLPPMMHLLSCLQAP